MKAAVTFTAQTREASGKGGARALRREGNIPSILYSNEHGNHAFSVSERDLSVAYKNGSFLNKLVAIELDGKTFYAVPKALQFHPVTDRIEHADFLEVKKGGTVKVMVPVKVLNADKSMGIKRGGTLNIVRHEIEMICAPDSIPSRIEVDIKDANIGDSIHISALKLPEGTSPAIKNRDFTVVTLAGRKSKDEDEAPAAAAAAAAPAAAAKAAPAKK